MYPVLILRAEVVCLVILVFLYFTSRSYKVNNESRTFSRLLTFALVHVCFDIITVLTVNNTATVPAWLNHSCHIIFYLSAILFSNELANYVIAICYPEKANKIYRTGHLIAAIYVCCIPLLKISYEPTLGTFASTGPAAFVGYGIAFLFFITALVIAFTHLDRMSLPIKTALIPMMVVLIIVEISQIIWRSLLFTGCAVTIVTVGFFFSLENPVQVFKQKAMTDALTGVLSRSCYEADIEKLNKRFKANPNDDYTFVFCDLNGLRSVNNRFGHAEGDNYITFIASAISRTMKHAASVYRTGGDEFLILYYETPENVVVKEIKGLQDACMVAVDIMNYIPSVSAGYAKSSASYKSLKDVIKTADYAMYQNKSQMKILKTYETTALGTRLNYAGLTDKIFDAMCSSNDRSYPFIMNLETNVTRISPAWNEYFGLGSEFFADFNSIWEKRIYPDDLEGFKNDIAEVLNGHKRYHNYDYLARRASGEYVRVSCHGSVYRDTSDGSSYFTGFMVNYGMDDNTDAVTGLRNFDTLTSCVCTQQDEKAPFAVLKLKLNNFARVNMLYGYGSGNDIIKRIAEILVSELGDRGEVFSQGAANFSILFKDNDPQIVESYYDTVSARLAAGVETKAGIIPVIISGGALVNNGEHAEIQDMRRGLVYVLEESHYSNRNKLVFYTGRSDEMTGPGFSLLSEIHADALADMQFFQLRYQPIVDTESRKTVGAEALLRWIHPEHGEIPPAKFIAFLENDPCYYRLGLEIINHAVMDAKEFCKTIPDFRISVNITALQLQNEHFADHVSAILEKNDFAPNALTLELTERCKEMDGSFLAKKISELRSRGFLVAFDDLGTGYSTVNILLDIPVDEIKLDREFIRDLRSRPGYQLFVRSLVLGNTSTGSGYTICFEGIEDEEMLSFVSQYGRNLAQGYYFAKPLLTDEFISYIEGA